MQRLAWGVAKSGKRGQSAREQKLWNTRGPNVNHASLPNHNPPAKAQPHLSTNTYLMGSSVNPPHRDQLLTQ